MVGFKKKLVETSTLEDYSTRVPGGLETGARPVCLEDQVSGWLFLRPNPWRSVGRFRSALQRRALERYSIHRREDPTCKSYLHRDSQPLVFSFEPRRSLHGEERQVYLHVSRLPPSLRSPTDRCVNGATCFHKPSFFLRSFDAVSIWNEEEIILGKKWKFPRFIPVPRLAEGRKRATGTMAGPASGEIQR